MKIVNGVYTSATIFTDAIEAYALAQIQMLCDNAAFEGCQIRIMPDVHPGKVGTIGFTSTVGRRILPNVVGIDIGCGMTLAKIKQKKVEYQKLDTVIRENVPSGAHNRRKLHRFYENVRLDDLRCCSHIQEKNAYLGLGTLGGGNHFIEVDKDADGNLYVVIHSGSRHLGKAVTEHYLELGRRQLKEAGVSVPYELTYLEGELMSAYIHDCQIVQDYAHWNRMAILDELEKGMKWKIQDVDSSVHNYVDVTGETMILRKGAVSAHKGENVIIPINMRDGILLGTGLGNGNWNASAPHGAGRIMKREDVRQNYTVSAFKSEMKGIYCSCIGSDTLDEAPFAYRKLEEIVGAIGDTVKIQQIIKPVYNFKAGSRD